MVSWACREHTLDTSVGSVPPGPRSPPQMLRQNCSLNLLVCSHRLKQWSVNLSLSVLGRPTMKPRPIKAAHPSLALSEVWKEKTNLNRQRSSGRRPEIRSVYRPAMLWLLVPRTSLFLQINLLFFCIFSFSYVFYVRD